MYVLGNIFALLDGVLYSSSGLIRSHKTQIRVLALSSIFFLISNICLGARSGILSCVFGVVRNCLKLFGFSSKLLTLVLVTLQVILFLFTIGFGNLIDVLPLVAGVSYTLVVMVSNSSRVTCGALWFNALLWTVYNLYNGSIMGGLFTFISLVMCSIRLIRSRD